MSTSSTSPDLLAALFDKHAPVEAPSDFREEHFEDIRGLARAINQYVNMVDTVARLDPDSPQYEVLADTLANVVACVAADILYKGYLLRQSGND